MEVEGTLGEITPQICIRHPLPNILRSIKLKMLLFQGLLLVHVGLCHTNSLHSG